MRSVNQSVESPTTVTDSSSSLIGNALSNADSEMLQVEVIDTGLSDQFAQTVTPSFKHLLWTNPRLVQYSYNNEMVFNTTCPV